MKDKVLEESDEINLSTFRLSTRDLGEWHRKLENKGRENNIVNQHH